MKHVKQQGLSHVRRGASLIEIIVALAVLTIFVASIVGVMRGSLRASRSSLHQTQAHFLLQESFEAVKIIRDLGWSSSIAPTTADTFYYLSFSGNAWVLATTAPPMIDGVFTRRILFSDVARDSNDDIAVSGTLDSDIKLFTAEVLWSEGAIQKSESISSYIANIFDN